MEEIRKSSTNLNQPGNSQSLPRKNRRSAPHPKVPQSKIRKVGSATHFEDNTETNDNTCPICFEAFEMSGNHRLVSLKCGHVFGADCINRWLKAKPPSQRRCPTCNSKATFKDVRNIYGRLVITSSNTQLVNENVKLKTEKIKMAEELEKLKTAHQSCLKQIQVLSAPPTQSLVIQEPAKKAWRFISHKNLELCSVGRQGILTYCSGTNKLYYSQNSIFTFNGIIEVDITSYTIGRRILLNQQGINDLSYSQPKQLVLSVASDRSARIIHRGIPWNISIQAAVALRSCTWDYSQGDIFYVGGDCGSIYQHDLRNLKTYVQRVSASAASPVVSLCATEYGLLSCQRNSCWLWINNRGNLEPRKLPIEGLFKSLCYDNESHKVSVLSSANEISTVTVFELKQSVLDKNAQGVVLFEQDQTFQGPAKSIVSRATCVKTPNSTWVASYGTDKCLHLNGLNGSRNIILRIEDPVHDVCSIQYNNRSILAALCEKRIRFYMAV